MHPVIVDEQKPITSEQHILMDKNSPIMNENGNNNSMNIVFSNNSSMLNESEIGHLNATNIGAGIGNGILNNSQAIHSTHDNQI